MNKNSSVNMFQLIEAMSSVWEAAASYIRYKQT